MHCPTADAIHRLYLPIEEGVQMMLGNTLPSTNDKNSLIDLHGNYTKMGLIKWQCLPNLVIVYSVICINALNSLYKRRAKEGFVG